MDKNKKEIIKLFKKNVLEKKADVKGKNSKHDGKEGQWLENQFGVSSNASNSPDILGYELKNQTTSGKTTFGDWSANEYIYNDEIYKCIFNEKKAIKRRDIFLHIFGQANEKKGGRYSWSGKPCPKIGKYNDFGQRLEITDNNDIIAVYNFKKDKRENKSDIVPKELQKDKLILAKWYGEKSPSEKKSDKCLKDKLEDKFNDKGWFTCKKNSSGIYTEICFGSPMNFDSWIKLVREGIVYFDSGMYEGNERPYSQWRANNDYWDSLIVKRYDKEKIKTILE